MEFTRSLAYRFPLTRGEDVRAVQQALIAVKAQPPCGGADGLYGIATASSVKGFQHSYNVAGRTNGDPLQENGVVESDTWSKLFARAQSANVSAAHIENAVAAMANPPPGSVVSVVPCLRQDQVRRVRDWMDTHFGAQINEAVSGTAVDAPLVYAIACQETASIWLGWMDKMTPEEVLARCVFDSSGDAPPKSRLAFPVDTPTFRSRMGDTLADTLIAEANKTRVLRGLPAASWVYKGYGIFQYDLQNILADAAFFEQRQWGDISICLDRFMREMREKLGAAKGDIPSAVARYNGAGPAAQRYSAAVMQMREWCRAPATV